MRGLDPRIHALATFQKQNGSKDVDTRIKCGHDEAINFELFFSYDSFLFI
jgi:hypothetical protein